MLLWLEDEPVLAKTSRIQGLQIDDCTRAEFVAIIGEGFNLDVSGVRRPTP